MTQVAKIDNPSAAIPAVDMAGSLMSVIERAARDPSVDIDKMERLIEMQERVQARHAKVAFAAALAEMQPKLPAISERGKILNKQGGTQSTYARWEDVNEAIRPLLAEHGFALSFRVSSGSNEITVTGVLSHRDGHSEETAITLPADTSGSKNQVQSIGSSTSYGKRYTAYALLNITSRGEDDDGVRGGMEPTITDNQAADIEALIEEVGANRKRFLDKYGLASLSDIPAKHFDEAVRVLRAYGERKAGGR